MSEPIWVLQETVLAMHDEQLAEHGGLEGVRDQSMLESALHRPQSLLAHGNPVPDLFDLAAAYAFGLARNHPFVDGNKRTSLATARTFLALNGYTVSGRQIEKVTLWEKLASGLSSEQDCAAWLRENSVALPEET